MSGKNSVVVIIPTKNRPELLDEAIASAQQQTHMPTEIIVVDDGSTVPVDEATLRTRHGPNIRLLRNAVSQGLAYSRNRGVEECSSDYIIHLDDDDLLAPIAIERCLDASRAYPDVETWFFGVQGFGPRSEYFNKVQPEGVDDVCAEAHGQKRGQDIVLFDKRLFPVLLRRVPVAFQRVFTTPSNWTKVSRLRWRAYMTGDVLMDEAAAKHAITGTLRDSEWARYAAAATFSTGLIDEPLYLARCAGQGYSSQTKNIEKHMLQGTEMKRQMMVASDALPELAAWKREILQSLASAEFDSAYHYFQSGNRGKSWHHLMQAFFLSPNLTYARFAFRMWLPRSSKTHPGS